MGIWTSVLWMATFYRNFLFFIFNKLPCICSFEQALLPICLKPGSHILPTYLWSSHQLQLTMSAIGFSEFPAHELSSTLQVTRQSMPGTEYDSAINVQLCCNSVPGCAAAGMPAAYHNWAKTAYTESDIFLASDWQVTSVFAGYYLPDNMSFVWGENKSRSILGTIVGDVAA